MPYDGSRVPITTVDASLSRLKENTTFSIRSGPGLLIDAQETGRRWLPRPPPSRRCRPFSSALINQTCDCMCFDCRSWDIPPRPALFFSLFFSLHHWSARRSGTSPVHSFRLIERSLYVRKIPDKMEPLSLTLPFVVRSTDSRRS